MKKKTMTPAEALAYLEEDPSRVLEYHEGKNLDRGNVCRTCPCAQALSALVGRPVVVAARDVFLDEPDSPPYPMGPRLYDSVWKWTRSSSNEAAPHFGAA